MSKTGEWDALLASGASLCYNLFNTQKGETGLKKTKQEKKWEKKSFRQAMDRELREHRSSFIVFNILRLLVVVVRSEERRVGKECYS